MNERERIQAYCHEIRAGLAHGACNELSQRFPNVVKDLNRMCRALEAVLIHQDPLYLPVLKTVADIVETK